MFMVRGKERAFFPPLVLARILFLLFHIILSVRQGATFIYLDMLVSKLSLSVAEELVTHQ